MALYADDTLVPVSRSREEIARLLQTWGAAQVQWADDYDRGAFLLRFMWMEKKSGQRFQARVAVQLQTKAQLEVLAHHGGKSWRPVVPGKLEKLLQGRGKREHRVLLLWLKAAFNAIELGLITAEELFLPWMEGADGQTVSEMALPAIGQLLGAGGGRLLLPPAGGNHG